MKTLRGDNAFADVTLACDDGRQFKVHHVIIAASSPVFQNLLKIDKYTHPLVYMTDIRSEDLVAVIDFIYYGVVSISHENIDTFLSIAEELKIHGIQRKAWQNQSQLQPPGILKAKIESPLVMKICKLGEENQSASPTHLFSGDSQYVDDKIKSMITQGETMWKNGTRKNQRCTVCGKEGVYSQIKNHIEANHIEGVCIPCTFCEKTFSSRAALKQHISRSKHIKEKSVLSGWLPLGQVDKD